MATVRGFGGRISSGQEHEVVPHGCHLVRTGRWPIWTVGEWTRTEIRTVGVGDRQVTVFGECAATDPELHRLAAHGVTNGVLTAFAGSYTVVESTAHRTTVFTDPGHARPIYISDTAGGVVWGSSALALAALTNAQPDIGWLGTALLVPQRPDLLTGRSAFVDITSVPPGSRLVLANDAPPQVRAAWNPAPPRASLAEGAVLLRTALSDAVAVRIDSSRHPSVDCSGGMDSTSLAARGGPARQPAMLACGDHSSRWHDSWRGSGLRADGHRGAAGDQASVVSVGFSPPALQPDGWIDATDRRARAYHGGDCSRRRGVRPPPEDRQ